MKKNKFLLGFILGLFVFVGVATAANFSDIAGHWAEANLTWAVNNGLLKGDDIAEGKPATLRPDDDITRAEMVTILKRYDDLRKSAENNNSTNDTDSFSTTVGGITWIGRKTLTLNSEGYPDYNVIKVDALGNASIVYKLSSFDPFSGIDWNFAENGKELLLKVREGGPEGGLYTIIGFIDGEEKIRSQYDQYGSFQSDLSFTLPGSLTTYNVTFATSKVCEGYIPNLEAEVGAVSPQTTLTGVKVSSADTSKLFELTKPITVDCAYVAGQFVDPQPQNIDTNAYGGISFSLPNGDRALLSTSDGVEKMTINFQDADSNYLN